MDFDVSRGPTTEPVVIEFRGQHYVNIRDVLAVLRYRQKHIQDNGYFNAFFWMINYMKSLDAGDDSA